jgi:hypothetical protein
MKPSSVHRVLDRAATQDGLEALHVQVQTLEDQDGEEPPALTSTEEPQNSCPAGGFARVEPDQRGFDVRVLTDLVGRQVVSGVLAGPPGRTHPTHQARDHPGQGLVPWAGPEDLPVRRVVTEKPPLRQHDPEPRGDDKLEPGLTEQEEPAPHRSERRQQQRDLHRVVEVAAFQQALRLDPAQQLGVVGQLPTGAAGHRRCSAGGHR